MAATGLGTTLGFGTTTTWSPDYLSVAGPSISRGTLQTSHLGTTGGFHTFIQEDLADGGEYSAEFFVDEDDGFPPFSAAPETITLTNSDGSTEAFTGLVTGYEGPTRTIGALKMATLVIKVAGPITFTPAA